MPQVLVRPLIGFLLVCIHTLKFHSKPVVTMRYLKHTKQLPIFITPQTINQKFIWRKFFDHNPLFTAVSDKLKCKKYVAKKVPRLKVARVLKIIETPEDINSLDDAFLTRPWVLKSTHGSGDVLVMPNGNLDKSFLVNKATKMLQKNHGRAHHEWGYFNVPKKLFFEEYIAKQKPLQEFKVYTFGPKIGRVVQIGGRFEHLWSQAWDCLENGELIESQEPASLAPHALNENLPDNIKEIISIAKKLGSDFDHMRVDLLTDGAEIWLGELTVYNLGGYHLGVSGNEKSGLMTMLWDIKQASFLKLESNHKKTFLKNIYTALLKLYLR